MKREKIMSSKKNWREKYREKKVKQVEGDKKKLSKNFIYNHGHKQR